MIAFIDDHRGRFGVEPICRQLPIAPSTYYVHAAQQADPSLRSNRAKRDAELRPEIEPIGNIPPAEAEARYYALSREPAIAA